MPKKQNEASEIAGAIREFIQEHSPPEVQDLITDSLPLIENGILNSLTSMELVNFLESRFGIAFKAFDMDPENFASIQVITRFVETKQNETRRLQC